MKSCCMDLASCTSKEKFQQEADWSSSSQWPVPEEVNVDTGRGRGLAAGRGWEKGL